MANKLDDKEWLTARGRAGARGAHSLPTLIGRIERRMDELAPCDLERLAHIVIDAHCACEDSPEATAAVEAVARASGSVSPPA